MRHAVLAVVVFSILALMFTTPAQSQTPEEDADLRARAEQGRRLGAVQPRGQVRQRDRRAAGRR